jgi:flagellar biosynthesis protein FliP
LLSISILSLALKLLLQVLLTGWVTISDDITDGLL